MTLVSFNTTQTNKQKLCVYIQKEVDCQLNTCLNSFIESEKQTVMPDNKMQHDAEILGVRGSMDLPNG